MTGFDFVQDKAYQKKAQDVLLRSIMLGLQNGQGQVILRTGDLCVVFAEMQAMLLASSPTVEVPSRLRECCEQLSAHTRRQAKLMQAHFAEHGAPFETLVIEGALN